MRILTLLISLVLITVTFCTSLSADEDQCQFDPTDTELADLGYKVTNKISAQWWYFDAVFSNNYSVVVGMSHLGIAGKIGFFFIRINIYQNGQFLESSYKFIPLRQITYSLDKPELMYKNSNLLKAICDSDGKIHVTLNVTLSETQVNLSFMELAKGWKGFMGKGWWACPLPKAQVDGILVVNDQTIPVTGVGYCEHVWGVRSLHRNWKWGKFSSLSTNTIFSKNMKNPREEDMFMVVINTDERNYTSINRENISYRHVDYMFGHGRFIPVKSVLEINQGPITLNVTFKAKTFHFTSLLLLKYWRLHMQINGNITIDGKTEKINGTQMMEYFYII